MKSFRWVHSRCLESISHFGFIVHHHQHDSYYSFVLAITMRGSWFSPNSSILAIDFVPILISVSPISVKYHLLYFCYLNKYATTFKLRKSKKLELSIVAPNAPPNAVISCTDNEIIMIISRFPAAFSAGLPEYLRTTPTQATSASSTSTYDVKICDWQRFKYKKSLIFAVCKLQIDLKKIQINLSLCSIIRRH